MRQNDFSYRSTSFSRRQIFGFMERLWLIYRFHSPTANMWMNFRWHNQPGLGLLKLAIEQFRAMGCHKNGQFDYHTKKMGWSRKIEVLNLNASDNKLNEGTQLKLVQFCCWNLHGSIYRENNHEFICRVCSSFISDLEFRLSRRNSLGMSPVKRRIAEMSDMRFQCSVPLNEQIGHCV